MVEQFYKEFVWGTVERRGPDLVVLWADRAPETVYFDRDWHRKGGNLRVTVRRKMYEINVPFIPRSVRIEP